ncbi:DNA-directed RNA polymerase subunit beta' [Candidatus Gromoviella agglomerans]|uniref:DNA-directed RNA polymerase subunit beta' n=1 Tax=Candidatus Gromoviella agglomerans TaxID=2806609 RepID=UPI003B75BD65
MFNFKGSNRVADVDSMFENFDAISLSIASPDMIRSWSSGEVKRPETINYRTGKPERDGLFCCRIFGPVRDYECICGKYKRSRYAGKSVGVVCEKCGVEVCLSKVRRFRMGHIDLASPVAHIWFTKSVPSRVATLLGMSMKELDAILYFEKYVVVDPGTTALEKNQLLSEEEYLEEVNQCEETGDEFVAFIGAEAIKNMLSSLDLLAERDALLHEISATNSDIKKKKAMKRLDMVESFIRSGNKPEWMMIDVLPVLPPDLRPLVPLDGGRFAVSDLNDLYRRVINRNNRLRRLIDLRAPDIIIRNERRMLQESVDALFDNSRRPRPILGMNKRPLKSLSDSFRGKQGRFRQNLLGKRVDYSGRSVIVVGHDLKLHQCGLPKEMAIELFKPFVLNMLRRHGYAQTLQSAKKMIEVGASEVWDVLEEVVSGHPVLLNRAPTLHRQSIQAFEVVLTDGKAIKLHPLVCSAFNADFDGDQMAVHVPLSIEAQIEARVLLMSSKNIRSPANGSFSIVPTKDMILGLYYLTYMVNPDSNDKDCQRFASVSDVISALNSKVVYMHQKIILRLSLSRPRFVVTTPGRCVLFHAFETELDEVSSGLLSFDNVNFVFSSKTIKLFFTDIAKKVPDSCIVKIADILKDLGFYYATMSGISFCMKDMIVPTDKQEVVAQTEAMVSQYREQFINGLLTDSERYNKVLAAWSKATEVLYGSLMKKIKAENDGFFNNIHVISASGARGSEGQIRQLCAIRGMMTDTKDEVIEVPVVHSFIEGLTVIEYFISTHGGRKGLMDTAFKTANAGYLTRRLVDVAQDCIICEEDCGCEEGIYVRAVKRGGETIVSLFEAIFGRFTAKDVVSKSGEVICSRNEYISEELAAKISMYVDAVWVRSPLVCGSKDGSVCKMCYGLDLAKSHIVDMYESVGIVAAQSISEPGTQLTMRNFQAGGLAQADTGESAIIASVGGKAVFDNCRFIESEYNTISVGTSSYIVLIDEFGDEVARYKVPYGSLMNIKDGQQVLANDVLASWDPYATPLISEFSGTVVFRHLIDGVSLKEIVDDVTGISVVSVLDWKTLSKGDKISPSIVVKLEDGSEVSYSVLPRSVLQVSDGDVVSVGDVLARLPKEMLKSKDITDGLQRVSELFEVKKQKEVGVMVARNGSISIDYDLKVGNIVYVNTMDGERDSYFIPRSRKIMVQNGDKVRAGDLITDGEASLHDILAILGVEKFADYLINEIQDVYRMQGIKISNKHFEVMVRQMLLRVNIVDPGDSEYMENSVISFHNYINVRKAMLEEGKRPPVGVRRLDGITKASLASDSFMSAASFRAPIPIITEAAINNMVDLLRSNKAASIAGKLIFAGTGGVTRSKKMKKFNMDLH